MLVKKSEYIRDVAYIMDKEAGFKDFIKNLVKKIPGMPSKEEALKTVTEFKEKNPSKFTNVLKEIEKLVDTQKDLPFATREAFDFKSFLKDLKGLADIKVIMSIIFLMGVFNVSNADEFHKVVDQHEKAKEEQLQDNKLELYFDRNKITETFFKIFKGQPSGMVEVDGEKYGVGFDFNEKINVAKKEADKKAIKSLPGSKVFKRFESNRPGKIGVLSMSKR